MEERTQQSRDPTATESRAEDRPPEEAAAQEREAAEQIEPQPLYDSFMRIIRR